MQNCLIFWCSVVAVLTGERLLMWFHFVSDNVRQQFAADFLPLLTKGLLFDIKYASVLVALPLVAGIAVTFGGGVQHYCRLLPKLLTVLFAMVLAAVIGNWFYFGVYGRPFDVFVFGLIDEDTKAVLKTMWSDYPVIRGLLGAVAGAWVFAKLLPKLRLPTGGRSVGKAAWALLILLPVALTAVGIRGSFGKFPLRQTAAQVSADSSINKLVPNALTALDWAAREYRNSSRFEKVSDSDGIQIISRLLDKNASADLQQFVSLTPVNPAAEKRQPNVVLAVMESMSAHILSFDNPQRRLLGDLESHWQQDWVYRKFISEGDGTSDTLHRFFVRSPRLDLSQSNAKNKIFPSNVFKPYAEAGYRTVYITAGNGGWRDFDTFLRHLGVDEFIDENTLKTRYPEAEAATWGVPDEFMFRYAEEVLQQAESSGKPVFIMMMSVTNHPPYRLPPPHQARDFALTAAEQQRLSALASGKELNEVFNTFRYSNDQLGKFIGHVKQHAADTVIAATGDHNMRAIGYPEPNETALGHGVPFYLYVPQAYRSNAVYRPERAGSHKDIMPTLYALSLSQRAYYQTGCNLTAATSDSAWCGYGYNPEVLITDNGFYHQVSKMFYPWNGKAPLLAETAAAAVPQADQAVIQRGSAYTEFLDWQINRMVTGRPSEK
ncbi:sulfatase-like hydrolase/transferase [Neisseria sp. ZJ106]|uniref:Sulfatase-like hydrolase/transferase n=1 Tax=Neisseria lisongii TaxID=2912188 RepID=A0ABY7RJD3_9NEIS|nr:alkaline phosphatase family protein [Neisseria lisongii]MCF7521646.1 sulfatase-like hydrolase/transferase [Neisseria lisongii]WCL70881.1 sulfatase-like hydrolase/transferase [Neisseria lisongii]